MTLVLVAVIVSLIIGFVATPLWANWLRARGYAQSIRDADELGYAVPDHAGKKGTPSMGGVVIVAGHGHQLRRCAPLGGQRSERVSDAGVLLDGRAGVGGFRRRLHQDLPASVHRVCASRPSWSGRQLVAIVFALLALQFPNTDGLTPATQYVSFVRDTRDLPCRSAIYLLWVWFMVAATSNAVNITDGLDGLATGAASMVFGAYVTVGLWQYNQRCADFVLPNCYEVRNPLDIAVVAAGVMGSCFGFLWWNTSPARIFMGDTGSLGARWCHGRYRDRRRRPSCSSRSWPGCSS